MYINVVESNEHHQTSVFQTRKQTNKQSLSSMEMLCRFYSVEEPFLMDGYYYSYYHCCCCWWWWWWCLCCFGAFFLSFY